MKVLVIGVGYVGLVSGACLADVGNYVACVDNDEKKMLSDRYDTPGLRYGDVKKELLEIVYDYFSPYRQERERLLNNFDEVYQALEHGASKASVVANEFIDKIRESMGIAY